MKTLQELKNKKLQAIKTIEHDENHEYYINNTINNLQPGYLDEPNNILIESKEVLNNRLFITATCKNITMYEINKGHADTLASLLTNPKIEYIERKNRYKITGENFNYTFDYPLAIHEMVRGEITFRAGGDYVFNGSYGDKIMASDLIKDSDGNIKGFTKKTYKNELIKYLLV